jgi:hypothetical protein
VGIAAGVLFTLLPVVIATAIGNFPFVWLRRKRSRFNIWSWHLVGVSLGTVAGVLAGLILGLLFVGALTGAACGLVQALIWWKSATGGGAKRRLTCT